MAILDQLPSKDRFNEILSPVLGDGESAGVSAAAKVLDGIKPDAIAAGITQQLDGVLGSFIPSNAGSALTDGITTQFQQALSSLPSDPKVLTGPVHDVVERILALAEDNLSTRLQSGVAGMTDLGALDTVDTESLGAGIAPAIEGVKQALLRGAFAQLGEWSTAVDSLLAEVETALAGAGSSTVDALVNVLVGIVASLERAVVPDSASDAITLVQPLRDAVSPARLTAVTDAKRELEQALRTAAVTVRSNAGIEVDLAAAESRLVQYVASIEPIVQDLDRALRSTATTPEGLSRVVERRLASFERVEIVDLGAIREKVAQAIGELEETVNELHLERLGETIRDAFESINSAITKVDLRQFGDELATVRSEMRELTESLEAALVSAVASARDLLRRVRDQLRSVLEQIGSFDTEGKFHFTIEQQIRDVLEQAQNGLRDSVMPIIADLKTTIGDAAGEVESTLQAVEDAIADVKVQLTDAVNSAVTEIENADLPGQVESLRAELASMLDQLGRIDFDVVVDPVVDALGEAAEALASIDTSSLNDVLKEALKVATALVTGIDFSTEITKVLTEKMDEVLAIPGQAIEDAQQKIIDAIDQLGDLMLEKLLEPLYRVYTPVAEVVQQLQLATLVRPLDEWHGRALQEIEKLAPEALLAPLIELHRQLTDVVSSISPAALVDPLRAVLDQGAATIEGIDVASIGNEIREAIAAVRARLDALAPEKLLDPIVLEFEKIVSALEAFDPRELLKPITQLFDRLTAPLELMTQQHASAIEAAFAPLVALPERMDPARAFTTMSAALTEVRQNALTIDLGTTIVSLRAAHAELRAATAASTDAAPYVSRVEALDPLRNDAIGRAVTTLRSATDRLAQRFPSAEPPPQLVEKYVKARPQLESLVPAWLKPPVTPESIRRAFTAASLLGIGEEVDQLYGAIKAQVQALNPRLLQEEIRDTYDHVVDALTGLDPGVLFDEAQEDLRRIADRMRGLDLGLLTSELEGIASDILAVVGGLDPRPIIDELDALVGEVRVAVEAIKPSELLAELERPLESVRSIVEAFHPEALGAPLRDALDRIEAILKQIDLRILLEPINDKLHELRDDLDVALDRTETAFDEMIGAIPL